LTETRDSLVFKFAQFVHPKAKLFVSHQLAACDKIKQYMGDNFINIISEGLRKQILGSRKSFSSGAKLKKDRLSEHKLLKQSLTLLKNS
jgi:hypothetical protein